MVPALHRLRRPKQSCKTSQLPISPVLENDPPISLTSRHQSKFSLIGSWLLTYLVLFVANFRFQERGYGFD
jgi:hypothetical protein